MTSVRTSHRGPIPSVALPRRRPSAVIRIPTESSWPAVRVPDEALAYGFFNNGAGTHTSRTLMLTEVRGLLTVTSLTVAYSGYQEAAVELNAVNKATLSTRRKTFRHLRELYGLSPQLRIFRALRDLWAFDPTAQPLLAASCAMARDPLMRASARRIFEARPDDVVRSQELSQAVQDSFPDRLRADTLARTGRNLASSWTQSGHLSGRSRKIRTRPPTTPEATAYALFLGHLCGDRGDGLFRSIWARLCDAPEHVLRIQAQVAARLGYLEYRQAGMVTEVGFSHLQRPEEGPS
jgi:hypothetical protein